MGWELSVWKVMRYIDVLSIEAISIVVMLYKTCFSKGGARACALTLKWLLYYTNCLRHTMYYMTVKSVICKSYLANKNVITRSYLRVGYKHDLNLWVFFSISIYLNFYWRYCYHTPTLKYFRIHRILLLRSLFHIYIVLY